MKKNVLLNYVKIFLRRTAILTINDKLVAALNFNDGLFSLSRYCYVCYFFVTKILSLQTMNASIIITIIVPVVSESKMIS